MYFKGTNSPQVRLIFRVFLQQKLEERDGNVILSEATNLQLNNEKFTFSFTYIGTPYEFQCDNKEQLDAWNHILHPILTKGSKVSREPSTDSATAKKEESKATIEKTETSDKLDKPDKPEKKEEKKEDKKEERKDEKKDLTKSSKEISKSSESVKTEIGAKAPITIGARAKGKKE